MLGTTILFMQAIFLPMSTVYAGTMKDTEEQEQVALPSVVAMEPQPEESQPKEALLPSEDESEESLPSETKATQESESLEPPKVEEANEPEIESAQDEKPKLDESTTSPETELDPLVDTRNATGTWGEVSWTWVSSTRTITLQGGTAGVAGSAPWQTHTDVVRIVVEEKVVLPVHSAFLFSPLENLERIDNGWNLDTSNVTNMYAMFHRANSLTTLDVSNWDTSSVTSMGFMFAEASSLTTLDVSNWDTSNVTNMPEMFRNTSSLTTLDVSSWDTSNVTTMSAMFSGASSLTTLDVSSWDTGNVTNMAIMFQNTGILTELDLSNWDTTRVTTATNMFTGAVSISTLHLGARSRLDHLANPPAMSAIPTSGNYTGNWVYSLTQAGSPPGSLITTSPANFWRQYNGNNPGTYIWQTRLELTLQASPAEGGNPTADETHLASGSTTNLTANPNAGYRFVEWEIVSGVRSTLSSTTDEQSTFTMGSAETIVRAVYEQTVVRPVDPLKPENEIDPENKPDLPKDQGLLSIDFVSAFQFGTHTISAQDRVYYAHPQRLLNEDGTINEQEERPNYIQISDRRSSSERQGWQLSVRQNEQFKGPQEQELIGARLRLSNQQLVTAQGGKEPSLQATNPLELVPGNRQTLIRAEENEGTGTWIYRFGDASTAAKSVALAVPQGATPEATSYQTTLNWELSAVPIND